MVEFEYIPIKDNYSHSNRDNNYQILEYRMIVYQGAFYFDDGIILNEKFNFYSQNLNSGEFLTHQNINIKVIDRPCFAVLIIKKQKTDARAIIRRDTLPR